MPCYHSIPAWRTNSGEIHLHKEQPDSTQLRLPCGKCLGCRTANAQAWALRCQLELHEHEAATFTTLTYDNKHLPPTLTKRDLQLFLKRLRHDANRPIRFFASGEYGEQNKRPHYHAILYGLGEADRDLIQDTWGQGITQTVPITPAAIAYVAGYTSKKLGEAVYRHPSDEPPKLDPTGTYFWRYQPPFIQMSRRPGIGGNARQYVNSWRLYAIQNGHKMPVPRFLHEAWKQQATPYEIDQLLDDKDKINNRRDTSEYHIRAAEEMAVARQALRAAKRKI